MVWALGDRPLGFSRLQLELGGVSTSVLADRLRELRQAAVVTTDEAGRYRLTSDGTDLLEALKPLNQWATAWSRRTGDG